VPRVRTQVTAPTGTRLKGGGPQKARIESASARAARIMAPGWRVRIAATLGDPVFSRTYLGVATISNAGNLTASSMPFLYAPTASASWGVLSPSGTSTAKRTLVAAGDGTTGNVELEVVTGPDGTYGVTGDT